MNYQEMTDFELELLVAKHFLGEGNYSSDAEKSEVYQAGIDGAEFLPNADFSPITSWADAGPILEENGITIIMDNPSMPLATNNCVGWYSNEVKPLHHANENPRRAGLVVFLMMKGGE